MKALILSMEYEGAFILHFEKDSHCSSCGKTGCYSNHDITFSICPECAVKESFDNIWEVELIKDWSKGE